LSKQHKEIADDTLQILEQGYYTNIHGEKIATGELIQKAVAGNQLYTPAQLKELLQPHQPVPSSTGVTKATYEVTNETTLDAVRRLHHKGLTSLLCLNFASAKNPGGGFLRGAVAQEESIARASALYPCLLQAPGYYAFHRSQQDLLYSDHMIYSPEVPVFKTEEGHLMDRPVTVSVITSAAVNAGEYSKRNGPAAGIIEETMRARTYGLLALCAAKGHTTLVLGAWGCGVFRNDPELIASLFKEALSGPFRHSFTTVIFAIKTSNEAMLAAFADRFDNTGS